LTLLTDKAPLVSLWQRDHETRKAIERKSQTFLGLDSPYRKTQVTIPCLPNRRSGALIFFFWGGGLWPPRGQRLCVTSPLPGKIAALLNEQSLFATSDRKHFDFGKPHQSNTAL